MPTKFQKAMKATFAVADVAIYPARVLFYDAKRIATLFKEDEPGDAFDQLAIVAAELFFPATVTCIALAQSAQNEPYGIKGWIISGVIGYVGAGVVGVIANAADALVDNNWTPLPLSEKYAQKIEQRTSQPS